MTARVFVTDLDGTLLAPSGEVRTRDRRAIQAMLDRGIPVAVCTGRMYSGTREIARRLGLSGPLACVDGSQIVESRSHRELACVPLSDSGVERLFEALSEHRPASFAFAGDRVFHDSAGIRYLEYLRTWSDQTRSVDDLHDRSTWHDGPPITAVVALGNAEQVRAVDVALKRSGSLLQAACFEVHRKDLSGVWGMVVRAAGVDKGTAIDWLARHHGVGTEDVVAVGDWLNDIPMLKRAGRSFAMAQAPESVRAAATDTLEADVWSGGGIAEAAERAGLL